MITKFPLQGFSRVATQVEMQYTVTFQLDAWSLSVTDDNGDRTVLPGIVISLVFCFMIIGQLASRIAR